MLRPVDYVRVRQAAAHFLCELQQLNRFDAAFATLPDVPSAAVDREFSQVRRLVDRGCRRNPLPPDEVVLLAEYRHALEIFGRAYVCGAEWAARATHQAKRTGRPIELPPGRERWIVMAASFNKRVDLDFIAGHPYPQSTVVEVAGELRALADELESAIDDDPMQRLEEEKRSRLEALLEWVPDAVPGTAPHPLIRAVANWRRLTHATGDEVDEWKPKLDRGLIVVARRLESDTPFTAAERKRLERARVVLNAAVNGDWNASPFDPSDRGRGIDEFLETASTLAGANQDVRNKRR